MVERAQRISIIGAGIGGLTAALALARLGHSVEIFEQAGQLGDVGAGLTLSHGALSALTHLGLREAVVHCSCAGKSLAYLHYKSAALLAGDYDHGDGSDTGADHISRHIHRADLHRLLVAAATAHDSIHIHTGHRLTDIIIENQLTARFENGVTQKSDLLIGADGLWSRTRAALHATETARFTGQVAYRFLMSMEDAKPFLSAGRSAIYFGPGSIFNRYSISRHEILNCVGIVKTDSWQTEGWSSPATRAELLSHFGDWHADVRGLMEKAPENHLVKWALFDRDPLTQWRTAQATLLGDAAHPMLPFMGLGAALAIEDAIILARCLEAEPTIETALARYETARLPRTTKLFHMARLQAEMIQSRDPDTYDASKAPAHDRSFFLYDPVTADI
jgi:salicylate hydroxylase